MEIPLCITCEKHPVAVNSEVPKNNAALEDRGGVANGQKANRYASRSTVRFTVAVTSR